jgi:DNA invertase Pin-like site-specific DNA recombinase
MRCAIYTRKSTTHNLDLEFSSLDAQREACEHYIKAHAHEGWTIVDQNYDDGGFTGANTERPAFQRLLADVEAKKIDLVVVYKVDRLTRSLLDFARLMDRFSTHGAAFVSVTQNFSTANALGKLTLNILMSFAEFEREMIAERIRDKLRASKRRGKWTGGRVPYGYDLADKRLVECPQEADIVREIFQTYTKCQSATTVARRLNARGLTTARYAAKGFTTRAQPWAKFDILRILKNPVYIGRVRTGGVEHPGEHLPLVDGEAFRGAQERLSTFAERRGSVRNEAYLLTGMLRCGVCGGSMTSSTTRRNGHEYRYYGCRTRSDRGKEACAARRVSAKPLEDMVVQRLRQEASRPGLVREIKKELATQVTERRKQVASDRERLPRELTRLRAEAERLQVAIGRTTGEVREGFAERLLSLTEQIASNQERFERIEGEAGALEEFDANAEWVVEALGRFDGVWDVMTLESRRRLLHALVASVTYNDATGTLKTELSLVRQPKSSAVTGRPMAGGTNDCRQQET